MNGLDDYLDDQLSSPRFDRLDDLLGRTRPPPREPRRAAATRDVDASAADVDAALRGALAPLVER